MKNTKQIVAELWKRGKSIAQIEEILGVVLHIDSSIPDLNATMLSGKFVLDEEPLSEE